MALRLVSDRDESGGSSQIVQPSVRVETAWTPQLIRVAEIEADGGNMRRVANLCDWLLGDDRIKGCLDARAHALFGLEPQFEPSGDRRRSNRAVRALEADEDWWDSYPESENMLLLIWGILLGFGPARNTWQEGGKEHNHRELAKPEFWHPQHMRYDWPTRRWLTMVASRTVDFGANEVEFVPGDGDWILHTPYGPARPWAMGLWRGLARLALMKFYAKQDWARAGETGVRNVVESDKDVKDNAQKRQEIANDLAKMGRDGSFVLPPGFHYKLIEISQGTKDLYAKQIDMANEAIAVLIRGGNLSSNVSEGSRAAAEVQERTGDLAKLRFDAQAFTTTIHDQSLTWWAERNFGDPGLAPWPVYPVQREEDLKSKADTMVQAAAALTTFQTLGFDIDREQFAEKFELSDFLKVPKAEPAIKPAPAPVLPSPPVPAAAPAPPKTAPPERALGDGTQFRAEGSSGAVADGQEYADRIVENMTGHGAKALAPTVASLMTAIAKAGSYDEARKLIVQAYGKLRSPVELAQMTEAALVMSQLGGGFEVQQAIEDEE